MGVGWQTWVSVGVVVLVVLTLLLAILAVFLIWKDGYRRGWMSRPIHPPRCLKCGYNLSGLTHCRCPECGSEFRLEELWQKAIFSTKSTRADLQGRPEVSPTPTESLTR